MTRVSMTNGRHWSVRALTSPEQEQAKELFEREISLIGAGSFDDVHGQKARVRAFMTATGSPAPRDTWLGIVQDGRVLGAVHTSPHYGQADSVLANLGRRGAASPGWLRKYVETDASVEEVAVDPSLRGQGAGSALMHAALTALADRDVRTVSGFATTPASIALFRSLKFTVGGSREPVPPRFAHGLLTYWWDGAPVDGRYFWKAIPAREASSPVAFTPGAAFGLQP